VTAEIESLVDSGCVVKCNCNKCPHVCNPLLVVPNVSGKMHLVLDLRYVNQFLCKHKFKSEGLDLVPILSSQGKYFIKFDLKSGCHNVDIQRDSWKNFGVM